MSQFLSTIDWATVLQTIWTIIIIPFFTFIGKQVKSYLETKKSPGAKPGNSFSYKLQ